MPYLDGIGPVVRGTPSLICSALWSKLAFCLGTSLGTSQSR